MEYPPTPPAEYEKNAKFFLNPLECLLPSESVTTGSEFVKPGTPAAMMIRRITNNILTYETSAMSRTRAYSPSFRCNTGLPFYASLLRELKSLVNEIDYQPSSIRGIVWAQLFTIVGTQQHYDGLFGPVLRDTMSQTTVNLLDIEVLLISFFLIINRYPQILDGDMTDVPLEPSEGQSLELERQAQRFFSQFRTRPAFISPPPVRSHGMTDLVQRARAIQNWAPKVPNLPDEVKVSIWDQCKSNSSLAPYANYLVGPQAVRVVNEWVQNLQAMEPVINAFYNILHPEGRVFYGDEFSQQLKDTMSPFSSHPQSPRSPPHHGVGESLTGRPHPMRRHASAPEVPRVVVPSSGRAGTPPQRAFSHHSSSSDDSSHDPNQSVYSTLRQQQEHTELKRPKKPFPMMKARSASAFTPVTIRSDFASTGHDAFDTFLQAATAEAEVGKRPTNAGFGFSQKSDGIKEGQEKPEGKDKDADILLASLLQRGGLLAKPTLSPHFGRYYPPPRHDPFIRQDATEGMEVEDRL